MLEFAKFFLAKIKAKIGLGPILLRGAVANKCQFEGKNVLYEGSLVQNCKIGYGTYIARGALIQNSDVGRFCSIGPDVIIVSGSHPTKGWISTHPAFFSPQKQSGFSYVQDYLFDEVDAASGGDSNYSVVIGADVWIGAGAIILAGNTVGPGAVIGAGAVVVGDIKPYSIVGGIPAREIGRRFEPDEVEYLLNTRWWEKNLSWIQSNAAYFSCFERFKERLSNEAGT